MNFLLWVLACLAVAGYSLNPSPCADTWWHLAAGRELWQTGRIVGSDPFTFTAGHSPWFNHEWGAEMIFYWVFALGGLPALFALRTCLVVLSFVVLPLGARGYGLNLGLALAPIVFLVTGQGFFFLEPRAYLFTYLLLSCTLLILRIYLVHGKDPRWLLALPLLVMVWANLHGGYILGPAVLVLAAFGCAVSGDSRWKRLVFCAIASMLLAAVNPYGLEIWTFPFSLGHHPFYQAYLNEWQPPVLMGHQWSYLLLLGIGLGLLYKTQAGAWEWLVVVAFLALGLTTWRHGVLAALVVCHLGLARAPREGTWPEKWIAPPLLVIALCVTWWRWAQGPDGWTHREYYFPTKAMAVFREYPELPERMLNPYEWGGYLAWELGPERKTMIDGRAHTLFPDQLYLDALTLQNGPLQGANYGLVDKSIESILAEYNADLLWASKVQGELWRQAPNDQWLAFYQDPVCVIYLRKTEESARGIAAKVTSASRCLRWAQWFKGSAAASVFLERARQLSGFNP